MQVARFVNYSHFRLVVADDFDEISHDVTEESDAAKHNYDSNDTLHITNRIVIAIADGTEGCQGEITADSQLVKLVLAC